MEKHGEAIISCSQPYYTGEGKNLHVFIFKYKRNIVNT